jgi:hypothetical protein
MVEKPVSSKQFVDLHPAWCWDCDNCGQRNYAHSPSFNLQDESDEDNIQLAVTWPMSVTCSQCKATYSTMDTEEDGNGTDDA